MTYQVAIIEDSIVLRNMLSEALCEISGVEVSVTASGQQSALLALSETPVDLVIIDLELDEGSGLGVIKKLRADPGKYGQAKLVVFSNYAISPLTRRCRDLGVDTIFDKSFQLPDLLSFVSNEVTTSPH